MKKAGFLARLRKEGRLRLVGPSEEIKDAYVKKSESHLASAKLLLDNGRLEESVSMAYYSMYHMLLALLFRAGIKCENHSAAIFLLKGVFGVDNSEISSAKRERIDKQYYVDSSIAEKDVRELILAAEGFNSKLLDFVERMGSEKIAAYREKTGKLL